MTPSGALPAQFEFVKPLGAGAFGDVVLARQRSLGRLVAIKRISRFALSDDDATSRFRREGQVLANLNHPSIVKVYDFVGTDAGALLVMEYVEGSTFEDLLAAGPVATPAALTILADVADALTAAARAGVVHRDIKPGNVFVLRGGHAKLGDFGLARIVTDPGVFRTAATSAGGTPAYFPPEVSQGAEPDVRSDAYSFAVMAYEALAGRRPIEADNPMAMIAAHWTQPVERPDVFVLGFPPEAAEALVRGLDKRPENRLLPAALMAALHAVPAADWPPPAARAPVPGRPSSASTRRLPTADVVGAETVLAPRRTRRRRTGLVVAGAAVLAAAGALAATLAVRGGEPSASAVEVTGVTVATTSSDGHGTCPRARYSFVARLALNGAPGKVVANWMLPGGRRTPRQPLLIAAGSRTAEVGAHLAVRGERPLTGSAVVHLTWKGGSISAQSRPIRFSC